MKSKLEEIFKEMDEYMVNTASDEHLFEKLKDTLYTTVLEKVLVANEFAEYLPRQHSRQFHGLSDELLAELRQKWAEFCGINSKTTPKGVDKETK
jgi:hypothetical protein